MYEYKVLNSDEGLFEKICGKDSVSFIDSDGKTLLGKFCGSEVPLSPITSSGQRITVIFQSNRNKVSQGFRATWNSVPSG